VVGCSVVVGSEVVVVDSLGSLLVVVVSVFSVVVGSLLSVVFVSSSSVVEVSFGGSGCLRYLSNPPSIFSNGRSTASHSFLRVSMKSTLPYAKKHPRIHAYRIDRCLRDSHGISTRSVV
jgi:hypothetical protein